MTWLALAAVFGHVETWATHGADFVLVAGQSERAYDLDALAASGVRFTSGYVSGPYCSPTRAALLTGRYQSRFGHEYNPAGVHGLPLTETTIADRLKAAGYVTGLVGKWHNGTFDPRFEPNARGFDEFFGNLYHLNAHEEIEKRDHRRLGKDLDLTLEEVRSVGSADDLGHRPMMPRREARRPTQK